MAGFARSPRPPCWVRPWGRRLTRAWSGRRRGAPRHPLAQGPSAPPSAPPDAAWRARGVAPTCGTTSRIVRGAVCAPCRAFRGKKQFLISWEVPSCLRSVRFTSEELGRVLPGVAATSPELGRLLATSFASSPEVNAAPPGRPGEALRPRRARPPSEEAIRRASDPAPAASRGARPGRRADLARARPCSPGDSRSAPAPRAPPPWSPDHHARSCQSAWPHN